MRVWSVTPEELGAEEWRRWDAIQAASPDLASPYFRPEFVQAVAAARADARIGVIDMDSAIAGFFPFALGRFHAGHPLGAPVSDMQGVVIDSETPWQADDLLRGCGLTSFSFDHLIASQAPFRPFHRKLSVSPIIDLSSGFDGWRDARRSSGSNRIGQLERKGRKIAREIGPLRFTLHDASPQLFRQVIAWKSQQCQRTGVYDFFAEPWVRVCMERILHTQSAGFAGMLSSLHAGDRLVAAHLGMRSREVLHWWFPVYDRELGRHSPGGLLLLELAKATAALGIRTIDLGKGDDAYKTSFQNGAVEIAEGMVHVPSASAAWKRASVGAASLTRATRTWLRGIVRGQARRFTP